MAQFDIALVAYTPDGDRLGPLPAPVQIQGATAPLNDIPSLRFEYLDSAPGAQHLTGPIEIAVEVLNPATGTWLEPKNSRYLYLDWDSNQMDQTGRKSYTCLGYVNLLDRIQTRPPSKAERSLNIEQAKTAAALAKADYVAACNAVKTEVGVPIKNAIVFAGYTTDVTNNGVWVDIGETPVKVYKGNRPIPKEDGEWVEVTTTAARTAAATAYERKLVLDDATAGITRAENDKSFDREFPNATAGLIMKTLIDEAKARGDRLPGMTYSFTSTHDSAGNAWAVTFEEPLVIKAGQSAFGVLQDLTDQGLCDWEMVGRDLRIYNVDTTMLRDRTQYQLVSGIDVTDAPDRGTYSSLTHNVLFLGEEGLTFEMNQTGVMTPWGKWEKSVSQGGVTSKSTGQVLGQHELDAGAGPRTESTRELLFQPGRPQPYVHYIVGDNITAIGANGVAETMRVRQVTLTKKSDGTVTGNLVLGDRFLEREVRQSRKIDGLLGGVIPRGNGDKPGTPVVPGERLPEAPYDLVVMAQNYPDPNGKIIGRLVMDWEWAGTDTNGAPIESHGYQVQIRADHPDELWASMGMANNSEFHMEDVRIRTESGDVEVYQVRVRTVAYNGRVSAWSEIVTVMMEADITPPPVPSAFTLTVERAVITAAWDGKGAGGEVMPLDFKYVEGEIAAAPEGPWTLFASFPAAGSMPVPQMTAYGTYWFRGRSVDTSGNYSEYGAVTSATTEPLVNLPEIQDLVDDYEQKFTEAMENSGLAMDSANGKNRVTHSLSLPSTDGKEQEGDVWWRYSDSMFTTIIGTWQWKAGAWVEGGFGHQVLDSLDAAKISVGFLDAARIRSKSITADMIMVGDFTNFASINALSGSNVTFPSSYATEAIDGYTYKTAGGLNYLAFLDRTTPIPFETSDWIRVTFDATSTASIAVTPYLLFADTMDASDVGSVVTGPNITINSGTGYYSYDIQVPASLTGRTAWSMGIRATDIRSIGVKNVRAYKKMNATLIGPDSIRTSHLGADIIESHHIKANAIQADRLEVGFADFITMTGSLIQTVATANRGIKISSSLNQLLAWNSLGQRTVYINGSNGDVLLGINDAIKIWAASGNVDIGNGKLTINGSSGALSARGDITTGNDDTFRARLSNRSNFAALDIYEAGGNAAPHLAAIFFSGASSIRHYLNETDFASSINLDNDSFYYQHNNGSSITAGPTTAMLATGETILISAQGIVGDSRAHAILPLVSERTTSGSANVNVNNGIMRESTSASKYKLHQKPFDGRQDAILDVPVTTWIDKAEAEAEARRMAPAGPEAHAAEMGPARSGDRPAPEPVNGPRRYAGVIAEDVAAAGLEEFVTYDSDGEINGVMYDRLALTLIPVVKKQRDQINELEARLAELEKKMENL